MTAVGVGWPWVTAAIIFECFGPVNGDVWLVIMKGVDAGVGATGNGR